MLFIRFTGTVKTSATQLLCDIISTSFFVKRILSLNFDIFYPMATCNVGGTKEYTFDLSTLDYVKSISFEGSVDDYGSITLNGSEIINFPYNPLVSYFDHVVSGTIPVSLFKKKANTVTLYSHDANLYDCNKIHNGTSAHLKLMFNY